MFGKGKKKLLELFFFLFSLDTFFLPPPPLWSPFFLRRWALARFIVRSVWKEAKPRRDGINAEFHLIRKGKHLPFADLVAARHCYLSYLQDRPWNPPPFPTAFAEFPRTLLRCYRQEGGREIFLTRKKLICRGLTSAYTPWWNFLLDDSSIRVQVLFLIFADFTAMRKLNPLIL